MKKKLLGSSILLLVAIIWGIAFIAVDYALLSGWQTFTILTARGLIAGLILLPFAIKDKFWKDKKLVLHCVIAGVFFFLGYGAQTIGQHLTSVVNSAFFTGLYVVFTPFLAVAFFKSKLKKKVLVAAFLSILGIFFLSFLSKGELSLHLGDFLLVLCALFFALQIVWVDRFLRQGVNPLTASSLMLLTMGICSSLCLPFAGETIPVDFKGFSGVLFAALFSSGVCSVCQFIGQKYVKSSNASLILSLETPFACVFSVMLGFDKLNIYSIIGILLMMSSIVVITIEYKKRYDFSKYKFLLIDVDDTLLDFKKAEVNAFRRLIEELGVKYKTEYLEKYSKDNLALWKRFEKCEIEKNIIFEERFKPLFELLDIKDDPVVASYRYLDYLSEESYLITNTFNVLERLSKKYDLYIISNGVATVQYPRIEKANIKQFFKGLFISEEIGFQKPKKEFFDYVSQNIDGFDISKAIVIGDSLTSDIKGAIDYGIDTCWFNPNDLKSDLDITFKIKSLSQIR